MKKFLLAYLLGIIYFCLFISTNAAMDPVYFFENDPWQNETHVGYVGHFKIPVKVQMRKWWIALIFTHKVTEFDAWQARYWKSSDDGKIVYIQNTVWNGRQSPGGVLDQRFLLNYEKKPGIDYAEEPTIRPVIVFLNKVYIPDPLEFQEAPMREIPIRQYNAFPDNFIMLPVEVIATEAPVTRKPLTEGPDSGEFWWVYTDPPPVTRPVLIGRRRKVPTAMTVATTATPGTPGERQYALPCHESLAHRQNRCVQLGKPKAACFEPQCSSYDVARYSTVQCWKYQGSCWCVDSSTGARSSDQVVRFKFMHKLSCIGGSATTTTPITIATTPPPITLASGASAMSRPPFVPRNNYDYNQIIRNSLLFFEAQRSGDLGRNSRIPWRSSAHTSDGNDCGKVDLSGGYYLSGDYVKFGFPTASALTMIAWGFLEFPDSYVSAVETGHLKQALKWGTDYLIKAHRTKYSLVGQVGNPERENAFWTRPEHMRISRPCYNITSKSPGSDLAGETAAAMAATAKVWLTTGSTKSDPYVITLLSHARDLYDFALKFRGIYSNSMRSARDFYPSSGYGDEIVWAALWLYQATGELRYLADAGRLYREFDLDKKQGDVSWDNKVVPVQVLMAKNAMKAGAPNAGQAFLRSVIGFCNFKLPGGGSRYTPQGLLFVNEWGTNRYAMNSAFVCLVASKMPELDSVKKRKYRKFAEDQMDYILGKTGKSFVVGYGSYYPDRPHHRPSSCSMAGACGWEFYEKDSPNPQVLVGAMVGGPDQLDGWQNDRTDFKSNGVSLDHNAGLQNAAAGLRHFQLQYDAWLRQERNNS